MRGLTLITAVAMLVSGCAGAPSNGSSSPAATAVTSGATTTPTAPTTAAITTSPSPPSSNASTSAPRNEHVHIENFAFTPSTLSLPPNSTVAWDNHDGASHTATVRRSGSAENLHDAVLAQGQSTTFTFAASGNHDVICRFHGGMSSTVTIT